MSRMVRGVEGYQIFNSSSSGSWIGKKSRTARGPSLGPRIECIKYRTTPSREVEVKCTAPP